MFFTRSINALFALAAIVFAVGCGSSSSADDGASPPTRAQLVERVVGDSVQTLDVEAAREEADGRVFDMLVESTLVRDRAAGDSEPLFRALDLDSVKTIVRSDGPPSMVQIATTQTWDDARKSFERQGWKPVKGDALLELQGAGPEGIWFVTGRDGLIVVSTSAIDAEHARDGVHPAPAELGFLIEDAGGVARAAQVITHDCRRAVGIGWSPARGGGEVSVLVDEPADASRARENGTEKLTGMDYKYGDPRTDEDEDRVIVPYRVPAPRGSYQLPTDDLLTGVSHFGYRC
jgi:hypothetical protein